jgi:hypothetical protein
VQHRATVCVVRQCTRQCVAVRAAVCAAVCGSACCNVRLSGSACGSLRLSVSSPALCDGVRQCTRQCTCGSTCGSACGSVQLSCSARSSVRLSSSAAVCGSATTRRSVLYHIRAVEARIPPPAPPRCSQYVSIRGTSLPRPLATIYHMWALEATQPPPAPGHSQYTFICCGLIPSPATICGSALASV